MNEISKNLKHLMENRKRLQEEGFCDLITKILAPLNGIGWELGPDINNSNKSTLALSVGFNKKNIEAIKEKIELPIFGDDWSVTVGVPPKDWDLYFIITASDGTKYEINGADWQFVDKWCGSKVKLELIPPANWSFNQEITNEAMKIILTGSLGELNLIEFVSDYKLKRDLNDNSPPLHTKDLRYRFVSNLTDCHYSEFLKTHNYQ